jgi:hypothetical protein
VTGSCEDGSEPSCFVNCVEILEYLRDLTAYQEEFSSMALVMNLGERNGL